MFRIYGESLALSNPGAGIQPAINIAGVGIQPAINIAAFQPPGHIAGKPSLGDQGLGLGRISGGFLMPDIR